MLEKITPAFAELSEFGSSSAGGKVVFATDDFFAPCENMIADTEPVFIADKYSEYGKWMDGWETRRKRIPGHDWCIIKLATKCVIKGFLVDTAFFTGNYAPKFSIQAACLTSEEESIIPERRSAMGNACQKHEIDRIKRLGCDKWEEIVPKTPLCPGYEETRMNYQKVVNDEAWTHIRVNIFPDGGIARLHVFGVAQPTRPPHYQMVDLVSMLSGGVCQGLSNAHYGHPRNMIKPNRGINMGDGWETARRLDRPEILEANENGTLRVPGEEWAVFKLGYPGNITRVCIDTKHFKGNFPDSVRVEAANLGNRNWTETTRTHWFPIVNTVKLSADNEHWFECDSSEVSHIRVIMAPDGGISRVRAFGYTALIHE